MKKFFENASEKMSLALKKTGGFFVKYEYLFYTVLLTAIALILRSGWLDFKSGDYLYCLKKWYDEIKAAGGLKGFASTVGDYTPMYKYIITLMTYIPIEDVKLYKYVSIFFDLVLAVFTGLTVLKLTNSKLKATLGYGLVLFLPQVFCNSAIWSQCDSIFTSFCVASFYFVLKDKNRLAMALYGVALSFKIQAIFFLPFIGIAVLKQRIRWADLLFIPLAYFLCALPAMIAGMGFTDALFGAYLKQVGEYPRITLNAPNLYWLISSSYNADKTGNFGRMAMWFAFGLIAMAGIWFFKKQYAFSDKNALLVAYFFAVFCPFVLPHMHERYFYLSDIFAVMFVLVFTKKMYVGIMTGYCSFRAVVFFLFDNQGKENGNYTTQGLLGWRFTALLLAVAIVLLIFVVVKELSKSDENPEIKPEISPEVKPETKPE